MSISGIVSKGTYLIRRIDKTGSQKKFQIIISYISIYRKYRIYYNLVLTKQSSIYYFGGIVYLAILNTVELRNGLVFT